MSVTKVLSGRVSNLSNVVAAVLVIAAMVSPAFAQRGMLDDDPVTPERPRPRTETPRSQSEVPRGKTEELSIHKDISQLVGCWHSESGELNVYNVGTGKRIGTSRNCYCFGSNGQGKARIIYTSQDNVPVVGQGKYCEGHASAKISGSTLTMQHAKSLPCTDGQVFDPNGPITWICSIGKEGRLICEPQPPYAKREVRFVRVTNNYCGWNG